MKIREALNLSKPENPNPNTKLTDVPFGKPEYYVHVG